MIVRKKYFWKYFNFFDIHLVDAHCFQVKSFETFKIGLENVRNSMRTLFNSRKQALIEDSKKHFEQSTRRRCDYMNHNKQIFSPSKRFIFN